MKLLTHAAGISAVLTAGLVLGTAAIAPANAADKPTLAFVTNGASDFWKAAGAGIDAAQKELPNFKLELEYPDQATVAAQQTLMDNLAAAGVKAIMVSAVDPKATNVLDKVAGQTDLFTTDSDAPKSKRIAYIGSSNVLAGKQVAEIAKKAMPDGGKCMGFVGLLDAANFTERKQGFVDGIKGSKITLVDTRSDGMDQTRAKSNVADVLAADPSINCFVGFYSYNIPEIYAAVKDAGMLGKVKILGTDADPVTLGGIKEGTIAGTVVQQPYQWAYKGMKLMAQYVNGDKSAVPDNQQIIIPTKIITKDNVDSYVADMKKMQN
ncbi:sugar-binding protein [Pararhizobium mangrovi]|uniref:Substrate-binding domain-containing protein n=1 Tax=Pararhizobium mangrovi TaxID=2590452 RepID=A0A506U6F3_9HYPH|nr:sugar-binding protein [Pararhizobium mangrovi]TPW28671.1 substrate-binding domain-containing protein [Pararhizobium mangrovi]